MEKLLNIQTKNGNEHLGGIQLKNKELGNTDWKLITEIVNGENTATYASGWYFVPKGTEITNVGIASQDYIVNYTTQKAVEFDGSKHTMLSYGSDLAVKDDSLIFSMPPSMIEEGYKGNVSWLNGVNAYGFAENYEGSFTKSSMIFNGKQYLCLPGDLGDMAENGVTFEFYGKLNEAYYLIDWKRIGNYETAQDFIENDSGFNNGTWKLVQNEIDLGDGKTYVLARFNTDEKVMNGLFCTAKEFPVVQRIFRAKIIAGSSIFDKDIYEDGIETSGFEITYSLNSRRNVLTDWTIQHYFPESSGAYDIWNQKVMLKYINNEIIEFNKDVHFTVKIDPIAETQTLYLNGVKISTSNYEKDGWENFISDENNKGDGYFLIGQSSQGSQAHIMTTCGEMYGMNLYTRALTDTEVLANYNAMTSYYKGISQNNGQASTGGNTGGTDLNDAEVEP